MFSYVTIGGVDGCIGRVCDLENHSFGCKVGIVGVEIVCVSCGSIYVDFICLEGSRRGL